MACWRRSNLYLEADVQVFLVKALMDARREVGHARRRGNAALEKAARTDVNRAKIALGERGPVWWTDGADDFNRRMVVTTPHASWYKGVKP